MRVLLLNIRDVRLYDELKQIDGIVHNTFEEAAHARDVWPMTMSETV